MEGSVRRAVGARTTDGSTRPGGLRKARLVKKGSRKTEARGTGTACATGGGAGRRRRRVHWTNIRPEMEGRLRTAQTERKAAKKAGLITGRGWSGRRDASALHSGPLIRVTRPGAFRTCESAAAGNRLSRFPSALPRPGRRRPIFGGLESRCCQPPCRRPRQLPPRARKSGLGTLGAPGAVDRLAEPRPACPRR